MTGEDRQYWPTDSRLAELREEGIVPYSPTVGLCVAALAAIAAGYMVASGAPELLGAYREMLKSESPGAVELHRVGDALLRVSLIPALIVAAAVVVSGLLQTRFWFSGVRLGFDLSRVLPRISVLNPLSILFGALGRLSFAVLLLAVSLGAPLWLFRSFLPLLNGNRSSAGQWLGTLANQLALGAGVACFALAFIGFILSRFHFRYRNRMTRQEMEQEIRSSGS